MRSSDWSSDVCSSDLADLLGDGIPHVDVEADVLVTLLELEGNEGGIRRDDEVGGAAGLAGGRHGRQREGCKNELNEFHGCFPCSGTGAPLSWRPITRSEEHTSELQSRMRISYAVLCLKKTKSNAGT